MRFVREVFLWGSLVVIYFESLLCEFALMNLFYGFALWVCFANLFSEFVV